MMTRRFGLLIFGISAFISSAIGASGDLDPTFGIGGKVTNTYGISTDRAAAVIVRNSGKIIVVGNVSSQRNRIGILRYNPDASLDTSFGANGKVVTYFGVTGSIYAHEADVQSDGKIVVIGTVGLGVGGTFFAARFNIDGSVDTTFSGDGYAQADLEDVVSTEGSPDIAIQSDGSIWIAGTVWGEGKLKMAFAKFNSDGSPNTYFWAGGTKIYGSTYDIAAYSIAVDANGQAYVAGEIDTGSNSYGIVRVFDTNGYLVTGHAFNGQTFFWSDPNYYATTKFRSIAIDANGKVVVAGTLRGNDGSPDFLTARFHPAGSLDTSFNYNGFLSSFYGVSTNDQAQSVLTHSDGKLTVIGEVDGKIALLRLTSSGAHDYTFGTMAWKTSTLGSSAAIDAALGANSKISVVAASDPGGDFLTIRFNSDGSIDQDFNPGPSRTSGWVATNFGYLDQYTEAAAIQADGKIVVTQLDSYTGSIRLVRYNPDGSLDTGFGTNGRVLASSLCSNPIGYSTEFSNSIAIQSDGKIVVGGYATNACASNVDFAVFRFNSNGSLDTGFGSGGYTFADFSSGYDYSTSIALQDDGKIVLAGKTSASPLSKSDIAVARFNTNGTLDTSFSSDGKAVIPIGDYSAFANSVAVQPSHIGGKIVVGGYNTTVEFLQQQHDFALVRLNSNGTMDAQFGSAGRVTTAFGSLNSQINDIVLYGTKIVAVGHARNNAVGSDFAVARYNTNGSLDTTFDVDGKVTTSFGSFNDSAFSVAIQADGKIVVGGTGHSSSESKDNFALARYLTNGALDTTFNLDGKVTTSFYGFHIAADTVKSIAIQPDGKILAAGYGFSGVNYNLALARYEP